MELMLKIAAGALCAVLCAVELRKNGPEFAVLVMLVAGIWILSMSAEALGQVMDSIARLTRIARLDGNLIEPVVKVVGLSVITRVAGESCRAAGEGGVAAFVEVAGTFVALAVSLPLVTGVVEMIAGLLV